MKGSVWRQTANQKRAKGTKAQTDTFHLGLTTEENLDKILKLLRKGHSLASIAKQFGCSYQAIQQIRNSHART